MDTIMQKIQEYLAKKEEVEKLYDVLKNEILEKAIDLLLWENKNLGKNHDIGCKGVYYSYKVHLYEDSVGLDVYSSWAYGGNDTEYHIIPYKKLFLNDWKEKAVIEYRENLGKKKKKELEKLEEKKRELEENELELRAGYLSGLDEPLVRNVDD